MGQEIITHTNKGLISSNLTVPFELLEIKVIIFSSIVGDSGQNIREPIVLVRNLDLETLMVFLVYF